MAKKKKKSGGGRGPTPKARAAYNGLIRKSFKRLYGVLEKKDPKFLQSVVG